MPGARQGKREGRKVGNKKQNPIKQEEEEEEERRKGVIYRERDNRGRLMDGRQRLAHKSRNRKEEDGRNREWM